uniref:Protein kinase domain-containing protein n=1 Tax=Salix viminalis TaxID=40686 RepID=A0A6N2L2Z8_SALVM
MNPKISDFGMARIFAMDRAQDSTSRVTSRVVGTFGRKIGGSGLGDEGEDLLTYEETLRSIHMDYSVTLDGPSKPAFSMHREDSSPSMEVEAVVSYWT